MSDLVPKATNKVVVTVEDRKFVFEKKQLTENSLYFEKMLNGSYKESEQNEIVLHDVNPEEFLVFRDWIFGITKDFRDVNCNFLLRLVVLADRFLLNVEFRKELYKSIKIWLSKDVSFPCKVLETAMFIGDQKLKDIFINWLYGIKLKDPRRNKWTLKELRAIYNATLEFKERRFTPLTVEAPQEVKEELNTLFNNHIQKIRNNLDVVEDTLDDHHERRMVIFERFHELRANFGENAELNEHVKVSLEELERMKKIEIDMEKLRIAIENISV